jgi:hypothetical protein
MIKKVIVIIALQTLLLPQITDISKANEPLSTYKSSDSKLLYNPSEFQWYNKFYAELNESEKSDSKDVNIAIFGDEIALLEQTQPYFKDIYDPYTSKYQKPALSFFNNNVMTKFSGILIDNYLNQKKPTDKNIFSFYSVPIYKNDSKLTTSVILNALNWAASSKIDIIYIQNSLLISQINESNVAVCDKISALRKNNIFTITLSGNEYTEIPAILEIEKCKDIITISPLDKKFDRYTGFTNTINPSFSLPAVDFPVYDNQGTIVAHEISSDPEFAAALFTYILSIRIAKNITGEDIITTLKGSTVDLPKTKEYDDNFLYTNTNLAIDNLSNEIIYIPKINSMVSDDQSSFYLTWESNNLFPVDKFTVEIYSLEGTEANLVKTINIDKNEVRAKVDYLLSSKSFVILTAIRNEVSYSSLPKASFLSEKYSQKNNPFAEILELKAKWGKNGAVINIVLNEIGIDSKVDIAILDGWSNQPLLLESTTKVKDYLWSVSQNSALRENPHYILAILNNKTISIPLYPEFSITAKVLSVGKKNIAVTGETSFACNSLPEKVGCAGSTILVIDAKTNKVLSETKVDKDLTFSSTFTYSKKTINIYVAIKGQKNEFRSNNISRGFSNR